MFTGTSQSSRPVSTMYVVEVPRIIEPVHTPPVGILDSVLTSSFRIYYSYYLATYPAAEKKSWGHIKYFMDMKSITKGKVT